MSSTRSVAWRGKALFFPFNLYLCYYHGYFVWRRGRHYLVNFEKLQHQAIDSEPTDKSDYYAESKIVKMRCPFCGGKWRQYERVFTYEGEKIACPFCRAYIPKNSAITK